MVLQNSLRRPDHSGLDDSAGLFYLSVGILPKCRHRSSQPPSRSMCLTRSRRPSNCIGEGHLAEAERLYAAILAVRPDQFDALQFLGLIKFSQGKLG